MAKINSNIPDLDYLQVEGTTGYLLQGTYPGVPPTTAETFQIGCVIQNITAATLLHNTGTVALPVWSLV